LSLTVAPPRSGPDSIVGKISPPPRSDVRHFDRMAIFVAQGLQLKPGFPAC